MVDTNVLVYAADKDSPHHRSCRAWLENVRGRPDAWYLTWSIVYEFLRVTTHTKVLRKPWSLDGAWSFVDSLLASPGATVLTATARHADVIAELIGEFPELGGNLLHDLHTVVLMREHGVARICTRDADFHRFSFLEVIDPLRPN